MYRQYCPYTSSFFLLPFLPSLLPSLILTLTLSCTSSFLLFFFFVPLSFFLLLFRLFSPFSSAMLSCVFALSPTVSSSLQNQFSQRHYLSQILLKDCKLEESSPEIMSFRMKAAEHFPLSVAFGTPVESMIDT